MAQRSRKQRRRTRPPVAPRKRATAADSKPSSAGSQPPGAGPEPADHTPKPSARETQPSIGGWRVEPRMSRSQRRDAEVRAGLVPLAEGERPRPIVVASLVAALLGVGNLIAYIAGAKIGGKHPSAAGITAFSVLMLVSAIGMWQLWYGAVLGFMALLAIVVAIFALLLIEASNLLGVLVALAVIAGAGYLFFKLVRVLSRIQMPRRPGS